MRHYAFRWNDWNLDHATCHGVSTDECERLVRSVNARKIGEGKYKAVGPGIGGRLIQVIFVFDLDESVYVLHARPLNTKEKRWYRRAKP